MLSGQLAQLYDVPPKVLMQAVRRNVARFPADFVFQLLREEWTNLRSQFVTSSWVTICDLGQAATDGECREQNSGGGEKFPEASRIMPTPGATVPGRNFWARRERPWIRTGIGGRGLGLSGSVPGSADLSRAAAVVRRVVAEIDREKCSDAGKVGLEASRAGCQAS
jgi:hypothetical protein